MFPLKKEEGKEENFFKQKKDAQELIDFFPGWIQTHMQIAAGIGKKAIVIKHPLTMFAIKEIEPFSQTLVTLFKKTVRRNRELTASKKMDACLWKRRSSSYL